MQKLKPVQIVKHLQQLADMAARLSDKIGIGQTRKPELERQMRVQRVAMDQRYFRQTKNPDPLGRLSEDSEDDDIAIHYRITLQTLQKHLPIPRIRKLVIADIIEVRLDLSFFEAGQLADRCFHERYGNLIEFARMSDSQKKAIPW